MTATRKATIAQIEKAAKLLGEQMRLEANRIQDAGPSYHHPQHEMRQNSYEVERYASNLIHSRGRSYA